MKVEMVGGPIDGEQVEFDGVRYEVPMKEERPCIWSDADIPDCANPIRARHVYRLTGARRMEYAGVEVQP